MPTLTAIDASVGDQNSGDRRGNQAGSGPKYAEGVDGAEGAGAVHIASNARFQAERHLLRRRAKAAEGARLEVVADAGLGIKGQVGVEVGRGVGACGGAALDEL